MNAITLSSPALQITDHPFHRAFQAMHAAGLRPCVMRADITKLTQQHEVDVIFPSRGLDKARRLLESLGWETLDGGLFTPSRRHLVFYYNGIFLKFDLYAHLVGDGLRYLDGDDFVEGAAQVGPLSVPAPGEWLFHTVMNTVLEKEYLNSAYRARLETVACDEMAMGQARKRAIVLGVEALFQGNDFGWLEEPAKVAIAKAVAHNSLHSRFGNRLRRFHHSFMQRCGKTLGLRRGFSLSVIGPDGAGKTSFIAALSQALTNLGIRTDQVYMGPWESPLLPTSHFLRRRGASPLDIHDLKPRPVGLMMVLKSHMRRILYYLNFLPEMWSRHLLHALPQMLERKVVLFDRNACDLQVGYYNQPMRNSAWLRRLLVRLSPRGRLAIMLDNDAEIIWQRKKEFPLALIMNALPLYRDAARRYGMQVIRTDIDVHQIVNAFIARHWRDLVRLRRDGILRLRSRAQERESMERYSHAYQLNQFLHFIGSTDIVSHGMFRFPSQSMRSYLGQTLYGLRYLALSATRGPKVLVRGVGSGELHGEVLVTDRNVCVEALKCLLARKPYIVARTYAPDPMAGICATLGLEPACELRAYLSLGALLVFFGMKAGQPVVIHVAASVEAAPAIRRHYEGLKAAHMAITVKSSRALVPDILSFKQFGDTHVLVQSRLPGAADLSRDASDDVLHGAIERALEPILQWRGSADWRAEGPDHALIHDSFPPLLKLWPDMQDFLQPLLGKLQIWQRHRGLTSVLTHGDYWIRNILFEKKTGSVSGVVDWERSRRHGTPGLDALHLALMTLAIERRRDLTFFLEQALTGKWENQFLVNYVARVQKAYDLDANDIGYLAAILYFDELRKIYMSGSGLSDRRRQRFLATRTTIEDWLSKTPSAFDPQRAGNVAGLQLLRI